MPAPSWILTEADIRALLDTVVQAAHTRQLAVTVAVAETGGHIVGSLRMDGAKLASIDAATAKAWTAAMFRRSAADYAVATAPGQQSWGLLNAFAGRMLPAPGGEPILHAGICIGGVGVSGASAEEDAELAREAVAALARNTR